MSELEETTARLDRIKSASIAAEEAARALKVIADQLRADVESLAERVEAIEGKSVTVAENLEVAKGVVHDQQVVQDNRLDTLET